MLVAALAYLLLVAITGSAIVGIVAAILVLLAGIPTGGFGFGGRWGARGAPGRPQAGALRSARRSRPKPEVGLEPTAFALQERCSTS